MSLRKDMTINKRVFHHNINNRPSYVIHHLILFIINIYYYLPTCGIRITCGHFREFTNVKEAFIRFKWYQSEVTIQASRVSLENRTLSLKKIKGKSNPPPKKKEKK